MQANAENNPRIYEKNNNLILNQQILHQIQIFKLSKSNIS